MPVDRRAIAVVVAIAVVGGIAWFTTRKAVAPSPAQVEIAIDPPPGWSSKIDPTTHVQQLTADAVVFTAVTARTTTDADPLEHAERLSKQLEKRGLTVERPVDVTFAGEGARLVVSRSGSNELCTWLVPRGRRAIATVQCAVQSDRGCRTACAAPIDRLRWPPSE